MLIVWGFFFSFPLRMITQVDGLKLSTNSFEIDFDNEQNLLTDKKQQVCKVKKTYGSNFFSCSSHTEAQLHRLFKKAYGREVYSLLGLKSFRARKSLATDFGAERQKFVTKSIHMGMATASDTCKYFCHF